MREYVIYAIYRRKRLRIESARADYGPLPHGAILITRVMSCDRRLMLQWARTEYKKRKSVKQLREACEFDEDASFSA